MKNKVNPFAVAPETVTVSNVELQITIPTAKRYLEISDKYPNDAQRVSLALIEECVTHDGAPLDADALPLDVFMELGEILLNKINPRVDNMSEDERKKLNAT